MGETQLLKCCYSCIIVLAVISFGFFRGANSETYTVGDEDEWSTGTNYLAWSERYNFSVGDILVFKYVAGQHNAYEVTEETYKSCNDSSGVLARYESGDDQVVLTEVKKYCFICTIEGHCLGGMRFTIDVKEATSSSSANTTNAGAPAPATTPDKDFASRPQAAALATSCLVFAFGVLALLQSILLL